MSFRVLVIGGRAFRDYARLRKVLDTALAKRLPDVELLTAGGAGVPALAASYARSRGLSVTVIAADHAKHPADARERRDVQLVTLADAAVVAGDNCDGETWELLKRLRAKRVPLVVLGEQER